MHELFQNVVTASFHGSIVIAAVILLRLLLKKAPKKFLCFLWLLAGIRLLMPFEIRSELSLQPEPERMAQVQEIPVFAEPMPEILEIPKKETPVFSRQEEQFPQEMPKEGEKESVKQAPSVVTEAASTVAQTGKPVVNWVSRIPYFWVSVVGCFALYCLYSYLRLRYQVREAIKIPGGWECENIDTAFILGFIRPRIYIPMGMPKSTRKHILAHERTHLEKGDHWFKMIGFLALAIHWFNPLVWVAYILLCKDIEMACDERVVQFMDLEERKSYSAALLSCSTNRAHFAACPVAFGEVSVKTRIKSVLNYRRPSFWISLLGVIAIVFVAVCLVTSPEEAPEAPAAGETLPAEETKPADMMEGTEVGFASALSESEITYTCEKAIEALKNQESYCIQVQYKTETTNDYYGDEETLGEIRRHGENQLSESYYGGELVAGGGSIRYDGQYGGYMGDHWAWSSEDGWWNSDDDVDAWLDRFSPAGKIVTFPEGTGVLDGNTVAMFVQWTEAEPFEIYYMGTYTFTFHKDGSLACATLDYAQADSEEEETVRYIRTMTVLEEDADTTAEKIRQVADQTMTAEELEEYRLLQDQVTEVPSNKTMFDKDFALGAGQMGWKFAKGEWFFKFGAEDVTPAGATLAVEYNGPYGNNTISSGTVAAGAAYFLEVLVDGQWVEVPTLSDTFETIQPKVLNAGSRQSINWEANYGTLPGGFYRIGNYYTFTPSSGEQDIQVAYAKFRIYDPEMDALVNKCRAGLSQLLASDSYHLLVKSDNSLSSRYSSDAAMYRVEEYWKNGSDYLMDGCSYYQETNAQAWGSGLMRRDGIYYDITWVGNTSRNPVSTWETVTYPDEDNFQIWSWSYELYDSQVSEIYRDGRDILVRFLQDESGKVGYHREFRFSFDEADKLTGLYQSWVYDDGQTLGVEEMTVLDTDKTSIQAHIDSQDISKMPAFSWEADKAIYNANDYEVRTKNFVNTTAKTIAGAQNAIDIAIQDCTLPAAVGLEPGTNMYNVLYDAAAGMWKVEFTASWDSTIYQAVYLNDQGITQMTLTMELEPAF